MDTLGVDAHTLFLESREVKIKQPERRKVQGFAAARLVDMAGFSWAGTGGFPILAESREGNRPLLCFVHYR